MALAQLRVVFVSLLAVACRSHVELEPSPTVESGTPRVHASENTAKSTDEFVTLLAGLGVRLRSDVNALEIDGRVNMSAGAIEVFACAPGGKLHESVVVLDCVPSGLQAGLIALGLEPGSPVEFGAGGAFKPPSGAAVEIELRWRDDQGREQTARAEDWIWDEGRGAAMERGAWIFAGSVEQPAPNAADLVCFAADAVKSLAVTYHDASSVLENPRARAIDDTAYSANPHAVPPVGTPIVAVFRGANVGGPR